MTVPPPAIGLANTTYAVRGKLRDGLTTTAELAALLTVDATPTGDDLDAARALRDAFRAAAAALAEGEAPAPGDLAVINATTAAAPHWRELTPALTTRDARTGPPVAAALAALAEDAITLLTEGHVRVCGRKECVLLFVKDHPRREWCSPGCGNKVRAARHYEKVKGL
ncbi:hypothetical protein Afil01_43010 [Actinorhabdospora filicis]|uniref:Zinc finger CGNR domain-containing protein n=1 Tax=Actinorhabdospora filicis TaxID=1785913 RepID=A0A9W6SP79_9ACTN|nr:CGNR zinc finger domain-containing protein [Actinorhabdospora filicis]GLZ79494.1 hypothetical protein Afil01_43010 [Actinorhabdospora filicis]